MVHALLAQYKKRLGFLQYVVTTDEICVHFFSLETKRASLQWHYLQIIISFFWGMRWVLYCDILMKFQITPIYSQLKHVSLIRRLCYNPITKVDIAPSTFYLFGTFNEVLGGIRLFFMKDSLNLQQLFWAEIGDYHFWKGGKLTT